jgi:hypothetical protein
MADAETTNVGGAASSSSGSTAGVAKSSGGATGSAAAGSAAPHDVKTPKADGPKFYVDGKAVAKDEYMKAAAEAGWNPDVLSERNYFPAVVTKKGGR